MKELLDLHAFADGELSKEEARQIREFISRNPGAQKELSAISNLIDCLRQKSPRHGSDECWTLCVGRLNQLDRARKVEGFVTRYAWAMCATLFVLIVGGRYAVKDVRGDTTRVADLLNIHSGVGSPSQRIQQQQFYSDLLRFSKQARSFKVVGKSGGTVLDNPVEKIDIVDKNGPLTFFEMKGVFNFEDASQVSSGSGYVGGVIANPSSQAGSAVNCVIWVDRDFTYVLAGPRSVQTLGETAVQLGLKSASN